MKGYVKCIIAGAIILGIGIAVLLVALAVNGWKFAPNIEFETQEFTATEKNTALSVNLDAGSLKIEYLEEGEEIQISYPVANGFETTITEKDGKLSIESNKHHWYTFAWGATIPETTVKIPKDIVEDVKIYVNSGTVDMVGGKYNKVDITVNAGTVNVGEISECYSFSVKLNAGTVKAISGVSADNFTCKINAGSAHISRITTLSGEIELNAGSASISFTGKNEDYSTHVKVSAGSCTGIYTNSNNNYVKRISVTVSAGSCNVNFLG
ncbi:MAG: DUF4097 domain-containing protein [Clostridia bacterium]|nr:DUF4097 domain-containing protein [Clostridia bacterium]